MKTSAVMIDARGERGFYRSVQDVPEPLRTRLLETTASPNSGVIVIADRAGKEQLTQVLAHREAAAESAPETPPQKSQPPQLYAASSVSWLAWACSILVLILSALIFALFQMRW
ncbi:MAG: hypothetical protein M3N93_02820 [Acidobacteriota bacterium]|nr:hypothetical protein [Acidobacteriota bacterium]